jgi:hypothetical protein
MLSTDGIRPRADGRQKESAKRVTHHGYHGDLHGIGAPKWILADSPIIHKFIRTGFGSTFSQG